MQDKEQILLTDFGEIRREFPFIRPNIRAQHLIPVYGLTEYFKDLATIKGIERHPSFLDDLKNINLKNFDLKKILSVGTDGWPDPKNKAEDIEMGKTALQNSFIVMYHVSLMTLLAIELT